MAADAALRQRAVIAAIQARRIGAKPEELTLGDSILPGEGRSLVAELAGQGEALRHQPAVDPDPLGGDVDQITGQAFEPLLMNFDSGGLITAWYTKDEAKRMPMIQAWIDRNVPGTDTVAFLSLENFSAARARMIRDFFHFSRDGGCTTLEY